MKRNWLKSGWNDECRHIETDQQRLLRSHSYSITLLQTLTHVQIFSLILLHTMRAFNFNFNFSHRFYKSAFLSFTLYQCLHFCLKLKFKPYKCILDLWACFSVWFRRVLRRTICWLCFVLYLKLPFLTPTNHLKLVLDQINVFQKYLNWFYIYIYKLVLSIF